MTNDKDGGANAGANKDAGVGGKVGTLKIACWCQTGLVELEKNGKLDTTLKDGASGGDVKRLHEHLQKFGFNLELSNSKSGKPVDSDDLKNGKWGTYTIRAIRMFAKHPQVDKETEAVITSDGKKLAKDIDEKLRTWCKANTKSPENYWEFKQLKLQPGSKEQVVDAYGADLGNGEQSAWHHHIRLIQGDLAKTGFGVHNDTLCAIGIDGTATGKYLDSKTAKAGEVTELMDLEYLVRKFQRQASWLWRMDNAGKQLSDVAGGDPSTFAGSATGILDQTTAKALHEWADKGYHMVMKKFELKDLHWPPTSSTIIKNSDTGKAAQLRSDAYDKWLKAATDISSKGGTLAGDYASSPRSWGGGKATSSSASSWSWHYSGLAVDISQNHASGDGTVSDKFHYVLEEEGSQFHIWCHTEPQDPAPADVKDDKKDTYKQYRNRNIKNKHEKGTAGELVDPKKDSDQTPLYHMTSNSNGNKLVTAKEGWYTDLTRLLEDNDLKRINRHADWKTNAKAWEWWHYQFAPPQPPGASGDLVFGDYLQLYGVHEYKLRSKGWSTNADIEHKPG